MHPILFYTGNHIVIHFEKCVSISVRHFRFRVIKFILGKVSELICNRGAEEEILLRADPGRENVFMRRVGHVAKLDYTSSQTCNFPFTVELILTTPEPFVSHMPQLSFRVSLNY